jgi:hypothetical protein
MQMTYQVIALAVMFSGMVSGFITFRMSGMRLAPHFGALLLGLILTLAGLLTGMEILVYVAAAFQLLAALTAFTQTWHTLKYNFQTSPSYAPHLALMAMLPVLAIASIL